MARGDYNQINKYSTSLQLNIGPGGTGNLATLKNICIVQAQCITRGLSADPNALYLVELTDRRGILANKWFQQPISRLASQSLYNIRAPAYAGGFYTSSLNAGVPWTWSTMLQDIWGRLNSLSLITLALGAWPGLPSTPTGIPEGFYFVGVPAWSTFNDIIEYLGMGVVCDLTQSTAPFTIVTPGNADSTFSALSALYNSSPNFEDDLEWIDAGSGRVPQGVTVFFRRRNEYYGSEETVRNDSLQWVSEPFYDITRSAPAVFSSAVGTHHLWSDFTIRYDQDGVALSADTATATTIAAELTQAYYNKIYRQTLGYMTRTYAGALSFTTGTQVDGVRWYQDYNSQDRQGWKTQIVRGAYPPWPNLWDKCCC